jgi:hypothetical protein
MQSAAAQSRMLKLTWWFRVVFFMVLAFQRNHEP